MPTCANFDLKVNIVRSDNVRVSVLKNGTKESSAVKVIPPSRKGGQVIDRYIRI